MIHSRELCTINFNFNTQTIFYNIQKSLIIPAALANHINEWQLLDLKLFQASHHDMLVSNARIRATIQSFPLFSKIILPKASQ